MTWLPIIGPIIEWAKTATESWAARKKAALDSELKINEAAVQAKIRYLETSQQADIAWENLSIQNAGWKDEWLTILVSIPLVMCFIPGMDVYVYKGFESLKGTPEWYQWTVMIVVASAFGYKKIADFMALKKGT
jgi:hypothetical protein